MKRKLIIFGMLVLFSVAANAQYRFHCEKDTVEVREIVADIVKYDNVGARIANAAESLIGRPADDSIRRDSTASLAINIDSFTPLSFVNSCLALARTAENARNGWRGFSEKLTDFSCRRGENNGFASLFYHTSDWIGDNVYRGNLTELTENGDARSMTASLDYLTVNRDEFAALKDDDVYDRVKMHEMGFRSHKIPYLPKQAAGEKAFNESVDNGDIIVLVSTKERSDYYDIGIVKMESDGPHLIHFSQRAGKVVKEPETLKRYFNSNAKYFSGFRHIRVKN